MDNMLNNIKNILKASENILKASDCNQSSNKILKEKADQAIDGLINHQDLGIVQEWRGKHLAPMIQLKDFVIQETEKLQIKPVFVSARLKMITTIIDKIKTGRHKKLSTMQDLGGVRIVFDNHKDLYTYYNEILKSKAFKILRTKDYIKEPKETGYRGIHIVYDIDGYNIELQLRTEGQHIWASTVETVGWYFAQDFKSGEGDSEHLEFFKESSVLFSDKNTTLSLDDIDDINFLLKMALYENNYQNVCEYDGITFDNIDCTQYVLYNEDKELTEGQMLDDKHHRNYKSNYFCIDGTRQAEYTLSPFLIQNIYNFNNKKDDLSECNKLYAKLENRNYTDSQKTKTLLVWVSDTSKLEDAYPCFFSQTKQFTDYLEGL